MKQIKKIDFLKVVQVLAMSLLMLMPVVSFAQLPNIKCSDIKGVNCNEGQTVTGFIKLVINWLLAIAGLIAVLFLIIGGFWYITSAGNEEQAEKGKGTVINAIIGIVIIVLSWVIVNIVSTLLTKTDSTNI